MARAVVCTIYLALATTSSLAYANDDDALLPLLNALNTRSFDDKAASARSIAKTEHPKRIAVLTALAGPDLHCVITTSRHHAPSVRGKGD